MKNLFGFLVGLLLTGALYAQNEGKIMMLNGLWDFEQTENAFPPDEFTRTCPVPGLIHLAEPQIDSYDKLFKRPDQVTSETAYDYRVLDYQPMYSWYRKVIDVPADLDGSEAVLTLLKSKYVTHVFVNGKEVGGSISCYTPIDLDVTDAMNFGGQNEIMVRIGERIWLPPEAAGSTDKEKVHYIPGIWDDVFLSFSGKVKIQKNLVLPSVANKNVTVKLLVRSFYPQQVMYGDKMEDPVKAVVRILDKVNGNELASAEIEGMVVRDNLTELATTFDFSDFTAWTPENPHLYTAEIKLYDGDNLSDVVVERFGMRDFERRGKYFYLNGEKYYLRGSNITLHRFFEDPDCQQLPWDREWVKKMLIDDPKSIDWNSMRICVGLVPDFWYDLADEYGMVFQNEWLYWQDHGWDEQIRKEYTDWVWSDGNHPSIGIWDAINENWNSYIGNVLIPELEELDPTRFWDAGYMQESDMAGVDPMDEPHLYRAGYQLIRMKDPMSFLERNPYRLGKMDDWNPRHLKYLEASATQLVNEYGWNWLWRDGKPAKLTVNMYNAMLGEEATPEARREFQAYWLACETEWIRAERTMAGVLAFCHLTNNYGYTGDWYINNIKDLERSPSFEWLGHAFRPAAVFIDHPDQRYFPNGHYETKENLVFNLVAVSDFSEDITGSLTIELVDADGKRWSSEERTITIEAFRRHNIPASIDLPKKEGGYLILSTFLQEGSDQPMISRRYIKVGDSDIQEYFEVTP